MEEPNKEHKTELLTLVDKVIDDVVYTAPEATILMKQKIAYHIEQAYSIGWEAASYFYNVLENDD